MYGKLWELWVTWQDPKDLGCGVMFVNTRSRLGSMEPLVSALAASPLRSAACVGSCLCTVLYVRQIGSFACKHFPIQLPPEDAGKWLIFVGEILS